MKLIDQRLALTFIHLQMFPCLVHVSGFKVVDGKLKLVLKTHFTIGDGLARFGIARPDNVINAVYVLKKGANAFESVGQLGADGIQVNPAALLEISKLRDLQTIEHYLPAHAPSTKSWRFPVVLFKLNVVLTEINANG